MKEYTVDIGGVEHTLQLDDEDAERYAEAKVVSARKVEDKGVKPAKS